jgi:hypothetical protein
MKQKTGEWAVMHLHRCLFQIRHFLHLLQPLFLRYPSYDLLSKLALKKCVSRVSVKKGYMKLLDFYCPAATTVTAEGTVATVRKLPYKAAFQCCSSEAGIFLLELMDTNSYWLHV